jgi:hypothetical protein
VLDSLSITPNTVDLHLKIKLEQGSRVELPLSRKATTKAGNRIDQKRHMTEFVDYSSLKFLSQFVISDGEQTSGLARVPMNCRPFILKILFESLK